MRKQTYAFLTAAALLALGTSPASALPIIYQENFNAPGTTWWYQGAWTQMHSVIVNPLASDPYDYVLQLRGDLGETTVAQTELSSLGFGNMRLAFDWASSPDSDASGKLYIEWTTGREPWKTVYEIDLGGEGLGGRLGFTSEDVAFGPTADNLANIQFRFRADGNALINNVVFYDPPPENPVAALDVPNQVPEPATLLLFGAGLAAVGFARRKRKS